MQVPLDISFRGMDTSDAVEARIREKAEALEKFYDRITSCRVVVEAPHRHHQKGKLYQVTVQMTVPGGAEIVAGGKEHGDQHAHEDVYVAIRDSFNAAKRMLEDHVRKARGDTKWHEAPPHGTVTGLFEDHGFITTPDGLEVYFHRNSVVDDKFSEIVEGSAVRFTETEGDEGPQASTVHLIGKHHIQDPDWAEQR